MKDVHLGEVIVERSFEVVEELGKEHEAILRIGKPMLDTQEGGDFYCPYQIVGIGYDEVNAVFGVDSLQALLLCLQKAAMELAHYQKVERSKVTWLGQDDLGLSRY